MRRRPWGGGAAWCLTCNAMSSVCVCELLAPLCNCHPTHSPPPPPPLPQHPFVPPPALPPSPPPPLPCFLSVRRLNQASFPSPQSHIPPPFFIRLMSRPHRLHTAYIVPASSPPPSFSAPPATQPIPSGLTLVKQGLYLSHKGMGTQAHVQVASYEHTVCGPHARQHALRTGHSEHAT